MYYEWMAGERGLVLAWQRGDSIELWQMKFFMR